MAAGSECGAGASFDVQRLGLDLTDARYPAIAAGRPLQVDFSLAEVGGVQFRYYQATNMTEVFGVPSDSAIYILALGVAYYSCILSPLIISAFVAARNRAAMNRRFLFVATITVATYGLLPLLYVVVALPALEFSIYLVPAMKARGYFNDSILLWIFDFLFQYWWAILPVSICLVAIAATRYFAKRWNRIVEAL